MDYHLVMLVNPALPLRLFRHNAPADADPGFPNKLESHGPYQLKIMNPSNWNLLIYNFEYHD